MPNLKPIVEPIDNVVMLNDTIAVSSFFTAFDPDDGDEITQYRITDTTAAGTSGFLIFQGQILDNGAQLVIDADDLEDLVYRGGPVVGNEFLRIQAFDGELFSDPVVAKAYTARPESTNPIAIVSNTEVLGNEMILASTFISGFDPDGFPIVGYSVRDRDIDKSFFSLDGEALEQGVFHNLSVDEFKRLYYNGVGRQDEDVEVRVFDGTVSSSIGSGNVNTRANLNRPVVNFASETTVQDELLPLAPLIVTADADGNTIKTINLRDRNDKAFSGNLFFQGEELAAKVWHEFTPDQLDQIFFRGGERNIDEQVRMFATDGRFRSARETILLTNVATGSGGGTEAGIPVLESDNLNENVQEQLTFIDFTTLYQQVDGGIPAITYEVIDTDPFPTSSTIFLDGNAQPSGTVLTFTDDEFDRLMIRTGTFEARNVEEVYVRADNGTFKSDWVRVNIHTEPEYFEAFTRLTPMGLTVATWDDFILQVGNDPLEITFSFMQQFPNYNTGEAAEEPARQPTPRLFLPFTDAQREWTRYMLNHIEEFANVKFVEVVDSPLTVDPVSGNRGGTLRFANYYRALTPALGGADPSDDAIFCTQAFGPQILPEGGDVWVNIDASIAPFFITNDDGVPAISPCAGLDFYNPQDLGPGTLEYWIMMDAVVSAMGEGLPFDLVGGGDQNPILPEDTSIDTFTVQGALTDFANPVTGYALYDVNYLQTIYGPNMSFNADDTLYSITSNLHGGMSAREVIWDGGGVDTLSAEGSTNGNVVVDLRPGFLSSIGTLTDNIFIGFGAEIENAIGSDNADMLIGNELNNVIIGGDGNDTIRGYGGDDTLTGGTGGDTFVFGVADGDNTINEMKLAGRDRVQFEEFPELNDFTEDFQFRLEGRDLVISLNLDQSPTSDTTVRIIDQTRGSYRIETLQFGTTLVDLDNLTQQATGANQRFELTPESTIFGNLVTPV